MLHRFISETSKSYFVKWQDHVYDFEIMIWNHISDSGKSSQKACEEYSFLKGSHPIKSTIEFFLKLQTVVECFMLSAKIK